jgi:hypothetical protein
MKPDASATNPDTSAAETDETATRNADRSAMKRLRRWLCDDSGMTSAEYAVGTLAAVAFAGLLLKVVTSAPIQAALSHLIERALK